MYLRNQEVTVIKNATIVRFKVKRMYEIKKLRGYVNLRIKEVKMRTST